MKFRPNSDDAVETLEEITKPASDLLNDPEFFKGAICQILDTVTENIGVEKPTSEEAKIIRSKLRCSIEVDGGSEAYIQCAAGMGRIFISTLVNSTLFVFRESTLKVCLFCYSGLVNWSNSI